MKMMTRKDHACGRRVVAPFALAAAMALWAAPGAAAQSESFSGFVNEPLGAAMLTKSGGHLTVSNIGSSGQDGFRIAHRGFLGHDVEWAPLDAQINNGVLVDKSVIGAVDGVEGLVLSHSRAEVVGVDLELRVDFPLAASNLKRVELYLDGELVAAQDGVAGPLVATVLPVPGAFVQMPTDTHLEHATDGEDPLGNPILRPIEITTWEHWWDDVIEHAAWVEFPWHPDPILGDELRVIGDEIVGPIVPDHTDVLFSGLNDVEVFVESASWEEHRVRGLASSVVDLGQFGLLVHDIGSSGEDGVAVLFEAADAATIGLGGVDASALPLGAELVLSSAGVMNGQAGAPLGELRFVKTAGPVAVQADYAETGGAAVKLELLLDGVPVHEGVYPNGTVLRCPELPDFCGKKIVWWPFPVPCYWTGWDGPLDVVVPGVGPFQADEARMLAFDPAGGVSQIDLFELRALDVPSFELTSIASEPILPPETYCEAKKNSQGCVPRIGYEGKPSLSSDDFHVTAEDVLNQQNGIMIFGYAEAAIPLQGGLLCIQPPLIRTPVQNSGGNALPLDCSGRFSQHFGASLMASQGLVAGDEVFAQYWYRDPKDTVSGTGLTDGLRFTIRP